jgi:outer membrane protein assembly factor BamB
MTCAEVKAVIEFYVLRDVSDTQRKAIAEHISQCPRCRQLETEYLTLVQAIHDGAEPSRTRLSFVLDLQNNLQKEVSKISNRSFRRRLRWAMGITAACAVLGIIFIAIRFTSNTTRNIITYPSETESFPIAHTSGSLTNNSKGLWQPVWQHTGAQAVTASAADEIASGGGRVYVLLNQEVGNPIAAYEVSTGKPLWRTETKFSGFLASDESRVYGICAVNTGEFSLMALDGLSGNVLWKKVARNKSKRPWRPCKPLVLSDNRLCWTTCNRLHLFESTRGKKLWSARFSKERHLSSAILVDSRLYVAGQRNFYCVDAETGMIDWQISLGERTSTWRQPLLTGEKNRLYISQEASLGNSRLICVNIKTQKITWNKTISRISHFCAADDRLYVRSQHIHALDARTGHEVWKITTSGCGPVTYAHQKIYFTDTSQEGFLLAVNGHSGEKVWQWQGIVSCSAFFRIGDLGIVKTNDGMIQAIYLQG